MVNDPLRCPVCGSTGHLRHFDGITYVPQLDHERLGEQMHTVRAYMLNGEWWRLAELAEATGYPEASISARLRDLRKDRFGAYRIERRRVKAARGTHEYRLLPPLPPPSPMPVELSLWRAGDDASG